MMERAFPHQFEDVAGHARYKQSEGMSLRDYFAGQAIIALMSSPAWVGGLDKAAAAGQANFKGSLAVNAYVLADAMLEARK